MLNGDTILLSVEGVHLRGLKKQSHLKLLTSSLIRPDLVRTLCHSISCPESFNNPLFPLNLRGMKGG
jgi:hypothetical protein